MPIYKLDASVFDDEKREQVCAWLEAHSIPPNDCMVPTFIDTDAAVIYWTLVVTPDDAPRGRVNGRSYHSAVAGQHLYKHGLRAPVAGAEYSLVGLRMETPLVVPLPAELAGTQPTEPTHKWDDYFNEVAAADGGH